MSRKNDARRTALRVRVNPIRCKAFGFCAEYLPEHFELDEWGYAWLRRPALADDLLGEALRIAKRCPTGAITVERADDAGARRR